LLVPGIQFPVNAGQNSNQLVRLDDQKTRFAAVDSSHAHMPKSKVWLNFAISLAPASFNHSSPLGNCKKQNLVTRLNGPRWIPCTPKAQTALTI
jgi:hypothetical protein